MRSENNKLTIKCQGKACPEAYKEGIVFEAEDTISKKYLNSSVRVPGIRKQALLKASADGEKMTWELGARLCYDKGLMLPSPSILQVAYSFQQNRKPDSCFFKPDYYWTIILPSNYAPNYKNELVNMSDYSGKYIDYETLHRTRCTYTLSSELFIP